MRLWHISLITQLPRQQLLGQHRECCALRGNGWGRKHATVDYVFVYGRGRLVAYHLCVIDEMVHRGYRVDSAWLRSEYRGKAAQEDYVSPDSLPYPEHNDAYLQECVENLRIKGVDIR